LSALSIISVIDDDASVRAATDNLLRSHGYIVRTFASAEEFLRSTHLNDTSCVIADVQMPAMSGVELLTVMRAQGYRAPLLCGNSNVPHPLPDIGSGFHGPHLVKLPSRRVLSD
jgi:FixJ family two-component response regulator